MSLFPEVRFKERLSFVKTMLEARQWRSAGDFFLRVVVWDTVEILLPQWFRRNWWIIVIVVAFLAAEVALVLHTISLQELARLSVDGEPHERLGLARLITAALTFLLALFGTSLAIYEIRRALARPRLQLSFQGLSPRVVMALVPDQSSNPGQHLKCCEVEMRVWNLSDVIAHHFKVRLAFRDVNPFRVQLREGPGVPGRAWQERRDLPGTQWEFRSEEPVRLYGQDVSVIGRLILSLPADKAGPLQKLPPAAYTIWIQAFIRDEWGGRQQTLQLTLEPPRPRGQS